MLKIQNKKLIVDKFQQNTLLVSSQFFTKSVHAINLNVFKVPRHCKIQSHEHMQASKDETPKEVIWIIVYLLTPSQDDAIKNRGENK